jgi:hypothetical protein
VACSGSRQPHVMVTDEAAMRLLRATREQLHGKPTREIKPFEVAEKAGVNPYQREYDETVRYLIDYGYVEPYPNPSRELYRMTNKGLEEILGNP